MTQIVLSFRCFNQSINQVGVSGASRLFTSAAKRSTFGQSVAPSAAPVSSSFLGLLERPHCLWAGAVGVSSRLRRCDTLFRALTKNSSAGKASLLSTARSSGIASNSLTYSLLLARRSAQSDQGKLAARPFYWWATKVASQAGPPSGAGSWKVSMGLGASLLTYFSIDLGIQVAGWAYSYWQQTDKFYDLTGSLTYLTLAGLSLSRSSCGPHQLLVTGMVALWATRLGSFLFARVLHAGKDDRLDKVKSQPGTFLLYWTVQAVWVFVVSLPMLLLNSSPAAPLRPLTYLGAGLWALGFAVEAIADYQKDSFRRDPGNKGKWIDSGLWRYSRHPNYFGEITLWTGAAACAASALAPLPAIACFLSPMLSYHLTCNVSGLPMVEKSANKRWGSDPAYQAYMRETSAVVPWFRKSNGT